MRRRVAALALAAGLSWASGGGADPPGIVTVAPPAPRKEIVAVGPGPAHVWVGGYWKWDGARHVWVAGRWVPERPGFSWVPARWRPVPGGWEWMEGHWKKL